VPIKEQTVIQYILDAARDGCEMNWSRFCEETGLTLEIASQIRLAIAKVGSRDKLKPIKDELPENVILLAFIAMLRFCLRLYVDYCFSRRRSHFCCYPLR
jgi:hypothetical protein